MRTRIAFRPALLLVAVIAFTPIVAAAHEGHPAPADQTPQVKHAASTPVATGSTTKVKPATLQGEIVDPQCWIQHDGRGKAHSGCALACSKAGQTLAFLDDKTGTLYQVLAPSHSADPNEPLYAWVGKPVIVKGDLMARGGMNAIVIKSVVADKATKQRP